MDNTMITIKDKLDNGQVIHGDIKTILPNITEIQYNSEDDSYSLDMGTHYWSVKANNILYLFKSPINSEYIIIAYDGYLVHLLYHDKNIEEIIDIEDQEWIDKLQAAPTTTLDQMPMHTSYIDCHESPPYKINTTKLF